MIATYNLDRDKLIEQAPVKNQCSHDYFYGQDGKLERALQASEGFYSSLLPKIIGTPRRHSDEFRTALLSFWLLQHLRTKSACDRAREMGNTLLKDHPDRPATAREEHDFIVKVAMKTYADTLNVLDDLKLCLVRNKTDSPFITSDDPAVQANRWAAADSRTWNKSPGITAAGVLVFLPLSSSVLAIGYDPDVYQIPHDAGWVHTKNRLDIHALNQHQFLNCFANIYLRNPADINEVRAQWYTARPLRRPRTQEVTYAINDGLDSERYRVVDETTAKAHGKALVLARALRSQPSAWPRFLQWREPGAVYNNGSGVGFVRRAHVPRNAYVPFQKEAARRG